ncbi:DUF262 domain-containing protein [Helicobacter sp. 23-1045]
MKNNAEKKTIEQIQTYRFEIPPYQRLYAWGEIEINTLLDDMKNAWKPNYSKNSDDKTTKDTIKNENKEYFIGNITTSVDKDDKNKFVLIDGQQRLTTLWFMGFYLASQNCPNWKDFIMQGDDLRIAMPIRDNEENALKELARKIADFKGENNDKKNEKLFSFPQSNINEKIKKAFECIESWFEQNIGKDNIEKFAEYIYTKVCFVFVALAKKTDLNRFFVRMNNRGVQLEKHEILKARILDKIKGNDNDDEWKKYAKIWDLCSDMDKYIFQSSESETYQVESIIDFPTFLLHCYKLWVVGQENEKMPQDFQISKDKLLDMIKPNEWNSNKAECFIESMLRYRVLFDSFVIKFTAKTDKDINDKESSYKIKRLGSDGKYIVDSGLKDLEMVQNYLRVARRGTNQNYEHWLTNFLCFLIDSKDEQEINEIKNFGIMSNFLQYNNEIKNELTPPQCLIKQKDDSNNSKQPNLLEIKLIGHLEKVDTKQIHNVNLKEYYRDENFTIDESFLTKYLSNGTTTPHYWFYRLEYYLWKWGKYAPEKLGDFNKTIGDYTFDLNKDKCVLNSKYFHFRMLGSIEHFSAMEREIKRQNEWNLNIFGNLALISQNLNSSLSNKLEEFKKDKVIGQLKRGRLESLKYFIMCANLNKDEGAEEYEWTEKDATTHQNQMIDILIKSLSLNPNDSKDSQDSKQ